jgi:hypothetical protein
MDAVRTRNRELGTRGRHRGGRSATLASGRPEDHQNRTGHTGPLNDVSFYRQVNLYLNLPVTK